MNLKATLVLIFSFFVDLHVVLGVSPICQPANPIGTTPQTFIGIQFDYIVVGGGTAGLAVASRLAENPNLQIGVIEAGNLHQGDPLIDIPHNIGAPFGNPAYDWSFVTTPQPEAFNRSIAITRGKILGGSSALNLLAWTRGSKLEYDSWQSFVPGSTWNWAGLLPYFKRATSVFLNQTNPFIPANQETRPFEQNSEGFTGPVQASFNEVYIDPIVPYIAGVNAIGIETNPNPDNGNSTGISNTRLSIDQTLGTRSYAASTYYCSSVQRNNFHVLTNAQATKLNLLVDQSTDQYLVTGVQFVSVSRTFTVNVKREVIISAGVFQSPQILELSGIGNRTILDGLGIKTLIDLPSVGENLQDHLGSSVQYLLNPGVVTFDEFRNNATFAKEQSTIYNLTRKGFLATTNSIVTFAPLQAFVNQSNVHAILDTFDQSVLRLSPSPLQLKQYKIQRQWIEEGLVPQVELILFGNGVIDTVVNESYITIISGQMHHLNRGSVHINTSIPLMPPVIDPGWLDNDFDILIGIEGIKLSTLIGSTPAMSTVIQGRTSPAPDTQSDASLINYFRQTVSSFDHPMGTNAMASQKLGGVVDGHLKVYGTVNLRVCDASVIPMGVGTHLQSTIYAIAEKLADMIKEDSI